MNVNTRYAYYDFLSQVFYDPRRNGAAVFGWAMPRLDCIRFRVAMTFGKARINPTTGVPLSQYRFNLSEYTSSLFALKNLHQFAGDSDGPLAFSNGGGFETSDTDWHNSTIGCITLAPIVIPITVLSMTYVSEIVLLKTNNRWTLRPQDSGTFQLPVEVQRDVYTGAESNAPSGLPGGLRGTWTISDAVNYVDVDVPDCTAACQLAIGVSPSTGGAGDPGTISQTPDPSTGKVRLSVGSAPGDGAAFAGNWTLLGL